MFKDKAIQARAAITSSSSLENNSTIDFNLLKIRVRRLKWIVKDAKETIKHFAKDTRELKQMLTSLCSELENSLQGVEDIPGGQQLYATLQAVGRWENGQQCFNNSMPKIIECINKVDDLGDKKAANLIVNDIQLCFESDLEPTWVEKLQAEQWDKFEGYLNQIISDFSNLDTSNKSSVTALTFPSCFISYAWGIPENEKRVHRLAKQLRKLGIIVYLDIWHNQFGSIPRFTEKANEADYVIVIGSPQLKDKWQDDDNPFIIKMELEQIIFNRIRKSLASLIKIVLEGDNDISFPPILAPYACAATDFSEEKNYFESFFNLLAKLFEKHPAMSSIVKTHRKNFLKKNENINKSYYNLEQSNKLLRDYYAKQNSIKRLFYDKPLLLQGNYIHLTVVNETEQKNKESTLKQNSVIKDINKDDDRYVEILDDLFKPKLSIEIVDVINKDTSSNTKILITGLAGIGKTTLSRYLSYAWASINENELKEAIKFTHWHQQFTFIFVLQLRELMIKKNQARVDLTAMDILVDFLIEKCRVTSLANASIEEIKAVKKQLELEEKAGHILLVLDGYDEIAREIPIHMQEVLKNLLNAKHVILTSRPYYLDDLPQKYGFFAQQQYRVTGFTDENIVQYIGNFFSKLDTPKIEAGKTLQAYLKRHKNLWAPCHVPINLELICSAWEQHSFEHGALTITELYTRIISSICMRYLEKNGQDISLISREDALALCEEQLTLLEHWAFTSIIQRQAVSPILASLEFIKSKNYVSLNIKEWIEKKKNIIKDLLAVGFIKAIGEGKNEPEKEYYFPHRTFQEFFAARFIADKFRTQELLLLPNDKQETLSSFIESYRLDISLELMWCFTAGLLYKEQENNTKNLMQFFNLLSKSEKNDLVSHYLPVLVMRCWDEAHADKKIIDGSKALQKIVSDNLPNFYCNMLHVYYQGWRERLVVCSFLGNAKIIEQFILDKLQNHCNNEISLILAINFINCFSAISEEVVRKLFRLATKYPIVIICLLHVMAKQDINADLFTQMVEVVHDYKDTDLKKLHVLIDKNHLPVDNLLNKIINLLHEDSVNIKKVTLLLLMKISSSLFVSDILPIIEQKLKLEIIETNLKIAYLNIIFQKSKLDCSRIINEITASKLLNIDKLEPNDFIQLLHLIENEALSDYMARLEHLTKKQLHDMSFVDHVLILLPKLPSLTQYKLISLLLRNQNIFENPNLMPKLVEFLRNSINPKQIIEDIVSLLGDKSQIKSLTIQRLVILLNLPNAASKKLISRLLTLLEQNQSDKGLQVLILNVLHKHFPKINAHIEYRDRLLMFFKNASFEILLQSLGLVKLFAQHRSKSSENVINSILVNLARRSAFMPFLMQIDFLSFVKSYDDNLWSQVKKELKANWQTNNAHLKFSVLIFLLFKNKKMKHRQRYLNECVAIVMHPNNDFVIKVQSAVVLMAWIIKTNNNDLFQEYSNKIFQNANDESKQAWCYALIYLPQDFRKDITSKIKMFVANDKDMLTQFFCGSYFSNGTKSKDILIRVFNSFDLPSKQRRHTLFLAAHNSFLNQINDLLDSFKVSKLEYVYDNLSNLFNLQSFLFIPSIFKILEMPESAVLFDKLLLVENHQYKAKMLMLNTNGIKDSVMKEVISKSWYSENEMISKAIEANATEFMDLFQLLQNQGLYNPNLLRFIPESNVISHANLITELNEKKICISPINHKGLFFNSDLLIKLGNSSQKEYYLSYARISLLFFLQYFLIGNWQSGRLLELKIRLHLLVLLLSLSLSQENLAADLNEIDLSNITHERILGCYLTNTPLHAIIKKYLKDKDEVLIPIIASRLIQENKSIKLFNNEISLWGKVEQKIEVQLSENDTTHFIDKVHQALNYILKPKILAESSRSESNSSVSSIQPPLINADKITTKNSPIVEDTFTSKINYSSTFFKEASSKDDTIKEIFSLLKESQCEAINDASDKLVKIKFLEKNSAKDFVKLLQNFSINDSKNLNKPKAITIESNETDGNDYYTIGLFESEYNDVMRDKFAYDKLVSKFRKEHSDISANRQGNV